MSLTPVPLPGNAPRDLEAAIAAVIDARVKAAVDEAIALLESALEAKIADTKAAVEGARDRADEIEDQIRSKEQGIKETMDGLYDRVVETKRNADAQIKTIEETLNQKVTRYLIPLALVVIAGLVLGAISLFGGLKFQEKLNEAVSKAATLDSNVSKAQSTFDQTTAPNLASLNAKIDQLTAQNMTAQYLLVKGTVDALLEAERKRQEQASKPLAINPKPGVKPPKGN